MRRRRDYVALLASLVLITGVVAFAAAPSAAAPTWQVTPTPSPPGPQFGTLTAVDCPTPTSCFAVGQHDDLLAQRWNGSQWLAVPIPTPAAGGKLWGISCPSPTSCFAVGSRGRLALIEHWNGTAWSTMSVPPGTTDFYSHSALYSVSCPSANRCVAVGVRYDAEETQTLVEHWNGSRWRVVKSPNRAPTTMIGDVSCATASSCIAVGQSGPATNQKSKPFAVGWDGTRWSTLNISSPSEYAGLGPVECPRANFCLAVSSYWQGNVAKAAVMRWDGTAWSIARPARPSKGFTDISCAGPASCMLVSSSVTERWNGKRWTAAPYLPKTSAEGVACPATSACFAVGSSSQGTANARWNGTRWIAAAPPSGASQAHFHQIACASPTQCLAIGTFRDGTRRRSLAERWNGTTWTYVRGPQLPAGASILNWTDLECPSATDCIAFGWYFDASSHPLAQRWDGSSWSALSVEVPAGAVFIVLEGLDCPSPSSCYAVGSYWTGNERRTLIEHWNGSAWSIVAGSPLPGDLRGVSCTSDTNCVAVGSAATGTLAVHWDGTTWTVVPSPNPPEDVVGLSAVSCTSPTSCVAVGTYQEPFGLSSWVEKPFAEAWDGSSWSIIPSPSAPAAFQAIPAAISCTSATHCIVVSGGFGVDDPGNSFAQQWDGSSWADVTLPLPPGTRYRITSDVVCTGAACMIAGSYATPTSEYSLVERYA